MRCFQNEINFLQFRMFNECGKAGFADFSCTEVLMAVNVNAEVGFRVVGVDEDETIESDRGIEFFQRRVYRFRRTQVITGRERMTSVQAYADFYSQFWQSLLRLFDVVGDFLKRVTKNISGACGELNEKPGSPGIAVQHFYQALDNHGPALILADFFRSVAVGHLR